MNFSRFLALGVLLVVLAPLPARAQAAPAAGIGIEAGVNASYLTVVPKGAPRSIGAGANVGLFASVPFISTFTLQPEVHYSQRKSKLGTGATERDVDLAYIDVPLLVRMPMFGIYMVEGPSFNFPVKAEIGGSDVKDTLRTDISLVIGVGRSMGRVSLEGRWESGFRRFDKPDSGGEVHRNRTITGLLSVRL